MAQAVPSVLPAQLVDAHLLPEPTAVPVAAQAWPKGHSASLWQVVQLRPQAPQFGEAGAGTLSQLPLQQKPIVPPGSWQDVLF
jgi:hypothetical protein